MVRQRPRCADLPWEDWPVPILVVEVLSPYTRRRDREEKRDFYLDDARIPEYWIVDPERKAITAVRAGHADHVAADSMTWAPDGVREPLTFALAEVFG